MTVLTLPLLAVELSAPFEDILTSPDASTIGLGISEGKVSDPEEIQQLPRHSCFRGDYTSLRNTEPGYFFSWDPKAKQRMQP